MNLTRRGFLATLAAVPGVGRLVPQALVWKDPQLPCSWSVINLGPENVITWQRPIGIVTGVYRVSDLDWTKDIVQIALHTSAGNHPEA